jgi:hypothetical protein
MFTTLLPETDDMSDDELLHHMLAVAARDRELASVEAALRAEIERRALPG